MWFKIILVAAATTWLAPTARAGRSAEEAPVGAQARGRTATRPVQIPQHRIGLSAEVNGDEVVSTLRTPTPIFRNGIMTFKDTDFFQVGLPEDLTATEQQRPATEQELPATTHKPITTASFLFETRNNVTHKLSSARPTNDDDSEYGRITDSIVVKNLPEALTEQETDEERTTFDPLTNLQDFLDLDSVQDIKEEFAYDYDQLAVESESKHQNISAADLGQQTAAPLETDNTEAVSVDTEEENFDQFSGVQLAAQDPVEFQVKKSTSSSFSQAVSKIMFTTTRDATTTILENNNDIKHEENIPTEAMIEQESTSSIVTQPMQKEQMTTLQPPTIEHTQTNIITSTTQAHQNIEPAFHEATAEQAVFEVTENAPKSTTEKESVDDYDTATAEDVFTETVDYANVVTPAAARNHQHLEHDGVTDEPLGGEGQGGDDYGGQVFPHTPGVLNIVEVHPTEGSRDVYDSENDYAYEEFAPTSSSDYDLSLLELDQLKELKASLEKKLGIATPPEIHDVFETPELHNVFETPELHDVFEYNPFLHSPKDIPTTQPTISGGRILEYDYTGPSYDEAANYEGVDNVEYEYRDDSSAYDVYQKTGNGDNEDEQPIYEDYYPETYPTEHNINNNNEHSYEPFIQEHLQNHPNQGPLSEFILEEEVQQKQEQHKTEQQHQHEHEEDYDQRLDHVENGHGHQLQEQEQLEQIFTADDKVAQLDPLVYQTLTNHLEDLHENLHENQVDHGHGSTPENDEEFLTLVHRVKEFGMHEAIVHAAEDHYSTQDNAHKLVDMLWKQPHSMMVQIKPKKMQPRLMIRLLYERVPHSKAALLSHLDDPIIEYIPLYRESLNFHMENLPMGKYIVCAEAMVDDQVVQNNCIEEDIARLDDNKLQSGVIAVISVAMFILICTILYAIWYRMQSIHKKRKQKEFESKVESIATKEKKLAEAEKNDSYITFTNEPYEERCIM